MLHNTTALALMGVMQYIFFIQHYHHKCSWSLYSFAFAALCIGKIGMTQKRMQIRKSAH